ncbi:hypothetical protein AB4Y85_17870 [Microvirga sp. 2YAF29]|uniref:hypothetical protein n=1 Tax=Microvirga sp. 2YAF29 TaxID=3233031 RepID=UPI003F9B0C61
MNFQPSRHASYGADAQARQAVRSSFSIIPHSPRPVRNASFIFGRSDARLRPLLNQKERDRMHCWAMIIALVSSVTGTTLLLTTMLP